ncbi:hypothetical protein KAR91_37690 [Candidatus Pacearchaeota archaeon]|nr:hypothetical protein [Candidatus Pacearchaeota archaeon]
MTETKYYPCYCRKCQNIWFVDLPAKVKCPKCNSGDVSVGIGKGMADDKEYIKLLESIIKTATPIMAWMVQDMKVKFNESGVPGDYSDELRAAIGILAVMEKV